MALKGGAPAPVVIDRVIVQSLGIVAWVPRVFEFPASLVLFLFKLRQAFLRDLVDTRPVAGEVREHGGEIGNNGHEDEPDESGEDKRKGGALEGARNHEAREEHQRKVNCVEEEHQTDANELLRAEFGVGGVTHDQE